MPFGNQSLDLAKLKYLNTEQALKDLAYFITQFRTNNQHNVTKNPWITVGGSYPGAMTAWFRYKYPHLTVGSISSSGVVNAIEDFTAFDESIYTAMPYKNLLVMSRHS
jgi:esterase/lipase superfamily enzyme